MGGWLVALLCLVGGSLEAVPLKRSADPAADYQQMGVKYDEYPVHIRRKQVSGPRKVVVPKRAALLLDRIMVALQKAVDEDNGIRSDKTRIPIQETMDLQRRGQQKNGRVYWRCYFNAVTCF